MTTIRQQLPATQTVRWTLLVTPTTMALDGACDEDGGALDRRVAEHLFRRSRRHRRRHGLQDK